LLLNKTYEGIQDRYDIDSVGQILDGAELTGLLFQNFYNVLEDAGMIFRVRLGGIVCHR